jgi:uroporphyrinogen decarboxylase
MAVVFGTPINNRLVSTIGAARIQGRNLSFPICSQTAIRPSFNQSNGTNVSGRAINESAEHQFSLMKWFHDRTGCAFAYPCMDLNLEGGAVAKANGINIAFVDMGDDVALEVVPFLDEHSILENLKPVDVMSDNLMCSRIDFFRKASEDTVLRDLILSAWMAGPFTLAGKITRTDAITTLSMSAMADPESKEADAFKTCLDYATATAIAYAKALEKAGAQSVVMLEPSLKWTNPFIFNEFAVPKINDVIANLGIPVIFHACGDTSAFFEGIASVRAEGFSLDKEVNLGAMSALRPDALMIGNLDNTQMPGQDPVLIKKAAQEMTRRYTQLDADGLYLPATGCEITSPITVEQLQAFAEGTAPSQR